MAKYEFTDEEQKVIIAFLSRVDLKGAEVPAFNQILGKLSKPLEEQKVE
jgi:hypothetical protein